MPDRPIVAVDCETTGLDPDRHDVFEVAYQRLGVDPEPITLWLPHTLANASPAALRVNRYVDRWPHEETAPTVPSPRSRDACTLRNALQGAHVLGCNPAFDTAFLRKRLEGAPWHHRLIDISAYAMGRFGWTRPRGMADVAEEVRRRFRADIPEPDHTAAGDVRTLVACWEVLAGRDADA